MNWKKVLQTTALAATVISFSMAHEVLANEATVATTVTTSTVTSLTDTTTKVRIENPKIPTGYQLKVGVNQATTALKLKEVKELNGKQVFAYDLVLEDASKVNKYHLTSSTSVHIPTTEVIESVYLLDEKGKATKVDFLKDNGVRFVLDDTRKSIILVVKQFNELTHDGVTFVAKGLSAKHSLKVERGNILDQFTLKALGKYKDLDAFSITLYQQLVDKTLPTVLTDAYQDVKVATRGQVKKLFRKEIDKDLKITLKDIPFTQKDNVLTFKAAKDVANINYGKYILAYGEEGAQYGWFKDGNNWKFRQKEGDLASGWIYDGKAWYYLDQTTHIMQTGWLKDKGTWYYLTSSGAMKTGWLNDKGTWYYLTSSGAMVANKWVASGNSWYYLKSSGAMAVNEKTPDGYRVNASGAWVK